MILCSIFSNIFINENNVNFWLLNHMKKHLFRSIDTTYFNFDSKWVLALFATFFVQLWFHSNEKEIAFDFCKWLNQSWKELTRLTGNSRQKKNYLLKTAIHLFYFNINLNFKFLILIIWIFMQFAFKCEYTKKIQ